MKLKTVTEIPRVTQSSTKIKTTRRRWEAVYALFTHCWRTVCRLFTVYFLFTFYGLFMDCLLTAYWMYWLYTGCWLFTGCLLIAYCLLNGWLLHSDRLQTVYPLFTGCLFTLLIVFRTVFLNWLQVSSGSERSEVKPAAGLKVKTHENHLNTCIICFTSLVCSNLSLSLSDRW